MSSIEKMEAIVPAYLYHFLLEVNMVYKNKVINDRKTANEDHLKLLDDQLKSLEVIHKKILQMETEDPSLDILETLYVELGKVYQEISKVATKQEEKDHLLDEVQQLLIEKENSLKELNHYRDKKEHLIKLLKFREHENELLRKDRDKLVLWMRKLRNGYKAILDSNSWKIGSAIVRVANKIRFKSINNITLKRMDKTFEEFEHMNQKSNELDREESLDVIASDLGQLSKWLNQLRSNMKKLLASRRWKFTQFIGHFVLSLIGKSKTPRQIKSINKIFTEYETESFGDKLERTKRLKAWIEDFEYHYRILINSKRWKASNKLFTFLNTILLGKQQRLVTYEIEDILKQFNKWKQNRTRHD